jgi:hypothetical protein
MVRPAFCRSTGVRKVSDDVGTLPQRHRRVAQKAESMETTMRIGQERERSGPLQGQVLRRSERREVAIFLLDDALWVADFVDGQGELVDAATWVRFNCGAASAQARQRMAFESALPLSDELIARIGALYRSDAKRTR